MDVIKIKRMKSIKEKAEEVFDNPFKQECFEAGANYVLDEIEKVIRSNSNCEKIIFELGKLVIQLKK